MLQRFAFLITEMQCGNEKSARKQLSLSRFFVSINSDPESFYVEIISGNVKMAKLLTRDEKW